MKRPCAIIEKSLCIAVLFGGILAVGQQTSKTVSRTEDDGMTFEDKHSLAVLPHDGDAFAVECAIYPPRRSDTDTSVGLVLHLHGRGGSCRDYNMMHASYAKVRRLLWERGYWLVVPNLGSDHWMNEAAAKSLDAIIEGMIQDRGVDPDRVCILGASMGAGSGLVYVMHRPGRVRAICAVFPMTDFVQWTEEKPSYLQGIADAHCVDLSESTSMLRDLSPLHHVGLFGDVAVLIIHGDADTIVPPHHSREFVEALRKQESSVAYHEVHLLGHDDVIVEPYQLEIADFLTVTRKNLE